MVNKLWNSEEEIVKSDFSDWYFVKNIDSWDILNAWSVDKIKIDYDSEYLKNFLDFTNPKKTWQYIDRNINYFNNQVEKSKNWLIEKIDINTLAKIFFITNSIKSDLKIENTDINRREIYTKNNPAKLSELLISNNWVCIELSLLAKKMLENNGIKSTFIFWEILTEEAKKELDNFWEAHSYLLLDINWEKYIFDPAQKICSTEDVCIPNIRKVPNNFLELIQKRKIVESKSIYGFNNIAYYWMWTWSSNYMNNVIKYDNLMPEKEIDLITNENKVHIENMLPSTN